VRLLAAVLFLTLLFAACGDDDSATPSPTSTLTQDPAISPGQTTPNPDACVSDELEAEVVSTDSENDATVITVEVTNTERACVFEGPPELRWYDADGNGLGVVFTPAPACEEGETDYDECVYSAQVSLPESGSNEPNLIRAIISVTDADALIPCASPTKQAETVGLQFPGVSLDVQVDIEAPVEMQYCSAQVDLVGYGPVLEG